MLLGRDATEEGGVVAQTSDAPSAALGVPLPKGVVVGLAVPVSSVDVAVAPEAVVPVVAVGVVPLVAPEAHAASTRHSHTPAASASGRAYPRPHHAP
jgi:hypothetical protein